MAALLTLSVQCCRCLSSASSPRSASLDNQRVSLDRQRTATDRRRRIQKEAALSAHAANDRALSLLSGYAGGEHILSIQVF